MKRNKAIKKKRDLWQFILLFLILMLFAHYESRNKSTQPAGSYTSNTKCTLENADS